MPEVIVQNQHSHPKGRGRRGSRSERRKRCQLLVEMVGHQESRITQLFDHAGFVEPLLASGGPAHLSSEPEFSPLIHIQSPAQWCAIQTGPTIFSASTFRLAPSNPATLGKRDR